MTIHKARVRENADVWYIKCPECKTRIYLDECPVPGGMVANIEICHECGTYIEVQPAKSD
jgi:acetyl-CoA carboxylase beta subunit